MQPKTTAKDFFFYLAGFATLYASAISLLSLLFAIVNKAFPDTLNNYYYYGSFDPYSDGMRMAIASLIVIFPIYLVIANHLNKYLRANPEKKDLPVRKWLTYLTLFITGATVATDLIVLLNTFLGGEITTRFVLKVLAVLIVAGAVFAYYFYDLKKSFASDMPNRSRLITIIASVLVLATLVGGFALLGSPMKARSLRFDERRKNDLSMIQSQIVYGYWQSKGVLPSTLADIEDPISGYSTPRDPQTGEAYVYERVSAKSFKLCANFALKSDEVVNSMAGPKMIGMGENDNWKHEAGYHCFTRTVDEDRYPVFEKATRIR